MITYYDQNDQRVYVDQEGQQYDQYGRPMDPAAKMTAPAQCRHCNLLHDAGPVQIVQRYADCSTWRCPGCKTLIDDRPRAWGGSALERR